MSSIVCVFAKPPVPGRVKTRLGLELGDTHAAALASAFLRDTWSAVSRMPWTRTILATTEGTAADFDLTSEPEVWLQGDGDLGMRIERIVRHGLTEADHVIAVGADTPGLPPQRIAEACRRLRETDAVIGPSDDGGFYLIGLRRCPSGLFADLPWSASTTCVSMQRRLAEHDMAVSLLDPWFDVDRPEDLSRLRLLIEQGHIHASATARLLAHGPNGGSAATITPVAEARKASRATSGT